MTNAEKEVVKNQLTGTYNRLHLELWEIESYDKIGAPVDASRMAELERRCGNLELFLEIPPRQQNLI